MPNFIPRSRIIIKKKKKKKERPILSARYRSSLSRRRRRTLRAMTVRNDFPIHFYPYLIFYKHTRYTHENNPKKKLYFKYNGHQLNINEIS